MLFLSLSALPSYGDMSLSFFEVLAVLVLLQLNSPIEGAAHFSAELSLNL